MIDGWIKWSMFYLGFKGISRVVSIDLKQNHQNYLINSCRVVSFGKPTRRAWKYDGVPTLCARRSLKLTLSVSKSFGSRKQGFRIDLIGVSHVMLKYI